MPMTSTKRALDNNGSDPTPAATGQDFAEMQTMIVGQERRRVDELEGHIYDPEQRAQDVGEVLAEAIQLRAARDSKLRRTLDPIFE